MHSCLKAVFIASGSAVLAGVAYTMMTKKKAISKRINEILFYGASALDPRGRGFENLMCISTAVLEAQSDVYVCVPQLARPGLPDTLLAVRARGVAVRVVVHSTEELAQALRLARGGVEVKVIDPDVPLEHEYVLVNMGGGPGGAGSAAPLAVLGSLDYSAGHVNLHCDSTLLTSDRAVVRMLRMEFDRVWHSTDSCAAFKEALSAPPQ